MDADYDVGNRAHEDYELSLDHVYRQWGLNEDGAWTERETFDFEGLLGEGIWTKRRRRFFAPYSETDDEPRKCVVDVQSPELSTGWHRVASGTVRLLADRCGIYFDLTDLDGSNSRLVADDGTTVALKDVTHVRLTAIVKSDERVAYDAERQETAGSTQTISEVASDPRCRWVTRHSSSAYAGEGTGVVRDDAEPGGTMEELAKRARETAECQGRSVRVSIPWVDLSLRVGERIDGIDGRDLPLEVAGPDAPGHPSIDRVTYDFEGQSTGIDLRMPG